MRNGRIVQTGSAQDIVLRPADDYVAEFVRRMNPLKVLTGAMIMRRREQIAGADGTLFLDEARRYRLRLDDGRAPAELSLDGRPLALCAVDDDAAGGDGGNGAMVAPASLPLQAIIRLRRATGHPVLLVEDGTLLGVCGESEILGALAARNGGATVS
jgi:glycine betaine/proline transport system ATP-binding protein